MEIVIDKTRTKNADKEDLVNMVNETLSEVKDYFFDKFNTGMMCLEYVKGNQWTYDEILAHYRQNRRPYVFNEIFNKVDLLIGTLQNSKMEINILPREPSDEKIAELINYIIKWIEQINRLNKVETAVFFDALVAGVGITKTYWEFKDVLFGYPKTEIVPFYEVFWDLNSKQSDLSDARWIARVQMVDRLSLMENFPEYIKEIDEVSSAPNGFVFENMFIEQYGSSKPSGLYHKYKKYRDLIPVIEYYDYVEIPKFIVYDSIGGDEFAFEKISEAEAFCKGKVDQYVADGKNILDDNNDPKVFIFALRERQYRQIVIISNDIVIEQEIATPFSPFSFNFGYYHYGDYWSFVQHLISPQDLINRSFSQLDYQLGTAAKKIMTVIPTLLPKEMNSIEKIRQEASKTSPVLPVLNHEAIRVTEMGGVNPELYQQVNFGIQRLIDYSGGSNFVGITEKAGESGRAIAQRIQQAGLTKLPLFERIKDWRADVAAKYIWFIQNVMDEEQIIKIIGTSDLEYIPITPQIVNSIKQNEYDIIVSETAVTETMQERYFEQIRTMFEQMPMAPEVIVPTLIEYSSLPESKKKEMLSRLEFYQQYIQQKEKAKHEELLQKQAADVVYRKKIRQDLQKQLGIKERES